MNKCNIQGNPLYSDDIGKMCYNAAKNWQIGWYDDRKLELNPKDRSSTWGTIVRLVGIANYDARLFPSVSSLPVVVKLETQTSNDYFIAFNRAFGINSENDEADDEVTIVQTGQNGLSYSQSWLKKTLKEGEEYVISGLGASGTDLIVRHTGTTKNDDLWIANLWIGTSQSTYDGTSLFNIGNDIDKEAYSLCQGDCDRDSDCFGYLRCFQRSGFTSVPGCDGTGISGNDYCYDAEPPTSSPTPNPTSSPTDSPSTYIPSSSPSYEVATHNFCTDIFLRLIYLFIFFTHC